MTESWETRNSREQKLENKETRKLGTDEKTNTETDSMEGTSSTEGTAGNTAGTNQSRLMKWWESKTLNTGNKIIKVKQETQETPTKTQNDTH